MDTATRERTAARAATGAARGASRARPAGGHAVAWLTGALVLLFGGVDRGLLLAPQAAVAGADRDSFECLIEPQQIVALSSPVEGLLESVDVDRGDFVKAGQVVATLESDTEQASLALALARADHSGDLEEARARLEFSERELDRHERLATQNVVAERALDEARTNLRRSLSELKAAQEEQELARLEVERAQALLARRQVRSPVDGVVTRRMLDPGEYVDKQEILELAQVDPLRVETLVPASLYGRIRTGMTALVTPDGIEARPHEAEVSVVDPVVDAASGTFGVRLALPNRDATLPAGVRCRVRFQMQVADAPGAGHQGVPAAPRR